MRVLVQRVSSASVSIDGEVVGAIGPGLLVFYCCGVNDRLETCDRLAEKVAQLRIFSDEEGKMNLSATQLGLEALVVSQFTLMADTKKGHRPSFVASAKPPLAVEAYERFVEKLREQPLKSVATGQFGADMQVQLCNDGPVTIWMDTDEW